MLPICFEEGVLNGYTAETPNYMNRATDTVLKNFLAQIFSATRSNGPRPGWIQTGQYKRQLQREQVAFVKGELRKSVTGRLPVEQESERRRRALGITDIRLVLDSSGSMLGRTPPLSMMTFEALGVDDEANVRDSLAEATRMKKGGMMAPPKPLSNGVAINGIHVDSNVNNDFGWAGGSEQDRMDLDKLLEEAGTGGF